MSYFVPKKVYLREILLHYFIQKKAAAEAHRFLVNIFSEYSLLETPCRDWSKNNDFYVEDKEHSGAPKKFGDEELEPFFQEDTY